MRSVIELYLDPTAWTKRNSNLLAMSPNLLEKLHPTSITKDTPQWVIRHLLKTGNRDQKHQAAKHCQDPQTLEDTFCTSLGYAYVENPYSSLKVLLRTALFARKKHPLFWEWLQACKLSPSKLAELAIAETLTPQEIIEVKQIKVYHAQALKRQYVKQIGNAIHFNAHKLSGKQLEDIFEVLEEGPRLGLETHRIGWAYKKIPFGLLANTPRHVLEKITHSKNDRYEVYSECQTLAQIGLLSVSPATISWAARQKHLQFKKWAAKHSTDPTLLSHLYMQGIEEAVDNPHTPKMVVLNAIIRRINKREMLTSINHLRAELFDQDGLEFLRVYGTDMLALAEFLSRNDNAQVQQVAFNLLQQFSVDSPYLANEIMTILKRLQDEIELPPKDVQALIKTCLTSLEGSDEEVLYKYPLEHLELYGEEITLWRWKNQENSKPAIAKALYTKLSDGGKEIVITSLMNQNPLKFP